MGIAPIKIHYYYYYYIYVLGTEWVKAQNRLKKNNGFYLDKTKQCAKFGHNNYMPLTKQRTDRQLFNPKNGEYMWTHLSETVVLPAVKNWDARSHKGHTRSRRPRGAQLAVSNRFKFIDFHRFLVQSSAQWRSPVAFYCPNRSRKITELELKHGGRGGSIGRA